MWIRELCTAVKLRTQIYVFKNSLQKTRWRNSSDVRSLRILSVFDGEPSIGRYAFTEKRLYDLDLCAHDLQNLISSWSECAKYFCGVWFKFSLWFMSYPVNKISMAIADWPWPLTSWPWRRHRAGECITVYRLKNYTVAYKIAWVNAELLRSLTSMFLYMVD